MFGIGIGTPLRPIDFIIGVLFQLCELDQWHVGLLPPYAFDLMLVHFLQSSRHLPVLHQVNGRRWTPEDADNYEADFNVIVSPSFLFSNARPYCLEKLSSFRETSVPVVETVCLACPHCREVGIFVLQREECDFALATAGEWNLADLLIGFFRYFAFEQTHAAQIRTCQPVTKEEKGWHRRRLAVEGKKTRRGSSSRQCLDEFDWDLTQTDCFYACGNFSATGDDVENFA